MIRLAIAEDHQSLIDGIQLFLEYKEDIIIVGTANDGEALMEIVAKKDPTIVLTDIRMPKMDGITVAKIIKKDYPEIKVIAFTMFEQNDAVSQMLQAGAKGYILKNSSLDVLHKAIQEVALGNTFFDSNLNIKETLNKNNTKSLLTKRQREILKLIAQGKTSREIADDLFIGIHTVDTHRKNMIRILGLHGKGELLRYALEKKYKF